jgi:hypothetical protein
VSSWPAPTFRYLLAGAGSPAGPGPRSRRPGPQRVGAWSSRRLEQGQRRAGQHRPAHAMHEGLQRCGLGLRTGERGDGPPLPAQNQSGEGLCRRSRRRRKLREPLLPRAAGERGRDRSRSTAAIPVADTAGMVSPIPAPTKMQKGQIALKVEGDGVDDPKQGEADEQDDRGRSRGCRPSPGRASPSRSGPRRGRTARRWPARRRPGPAGGSPGRATRSPPTARRPQRSSQWDVHPEDGRPRGRCWRSRPGCRWRWESACGGTP